MTPRQTPDAVREAIRADITKQLDAPWRDRVILRPEQWRVVLAALDSRAGDAGEGMARHLLDALNNSEELMNGDVVLTAEHAKQLNADVDAWEATEPFSPEDAWDELVNVDDRTSPEEYPDMCLITRDELIGFMARATPAPAVDAVPAGEVDKLIAEGQIAVGFKPHHGGPKPADWSGRAVQFRSGKVMRIEPGVVWKLGWDHSYGDGDVVAYEPAALSHGEGRK